MFKKSVEITAGPAKLIISNCGNTVPWTCLGGDIRTKIEFEDSQGQVITEEYLNEIPLYGLPFRIRLWLSE